MPYRIDIPGAGGDLAARVIELGAIDVELSDGGTLAVLMPDSVAPDLVTSMPGVAGTSLSPALPRDAGSVWVLSPRPVHAGRLRIVPADDESSGPDVIRLIDSGAFGTGLHPTTALCLEALDDLVQDAPPLGVLDVGTGSGILALAALTLGVPQALGIDTDAEALGVAAENARLNRVEARLRLEHGGPEAVTGTWPLVLANVLAAPLIEMAPALVRRLGHHGRLVLSGIPTSVEPDVDRTYRRLGLSRVQVTSRGGWVALVLEASW